MRTPQQRRAFTWALGAGLFAVASCGRTPALEEGSLRPVPEWVVLLSLDTLRADRLDCYGYERETAPHLARLAREGWLFRTVLAQASQTLVSHKSLFAGRYPHGLLAESSGGELAGGARSQAQLPRPDPRGFLVEGLSATDGGLIEHMRAAGWRTVAYTDGGWMRKELGFDRGFERFDDQGGGLARILPRALAWMESAPAAPTLLFLHAYDVHCPYPTREPYDSRFCTSHAGHVELSGRCAKNDLEREALGPADFAAIGDHYDASIASADAHLGAFFDALRARGIWDEALVIVTSDHGESLGERGRIGHGELLLEELLVPLLVKLPASWGVAPRAVEQPFELVDLMPSVLDACGVEPPAELDGRSFLPLLADQPAGREALIAQTVFRAQGSGEADPEAAAGLIANRFFVRQSGATGDEGQDWFFFDLLEDSRALVPATGVAPEVVRELVLRLSALRAARPAARASGSAEAHGLPAGLPSSVREQLRDLGYADG